MLIDRQSLRDSAAWIVIALVTLLGSTLAYIIYAARAPAGPSGGSVPGLVFAGVGTLIILFAWALTIRRWRRSARIGRAYTWLQGHVYLSIISYPIILYHAGFRLGGPLTTALMGAFTLCYVSGVLLLLVQQVVPRLMVSEVPLETIYDQIDHVARQNLAAADQLIEAHAVVAATVPDLGEDEFQATAAASRAPTAPAELRAFYDTRVRPYLAAGMRPATRSKRVGVLAWWIAAARDALMLRRGQPAPVSREDFAAARAKLPGLRTVLDTLESFTEQRRQFALQRRLHHLLHAWLLIHVPTAWIMIVLLPLHAVMSVRYL
ncbi:MAG TPA: hypothetical protein VH475_04315 [Tepidisphaeraceae bacterium]